MPYITEQVRKHLTPTSCDRILHNTNLALNSTAPNKLTHTLDLFIVFHAARSQITSFTKRFTFLGGSTFICACPSQHSHGAGGRVSHAVVWGRVKVDQVRVLSSYQAISVAVDVSFVKVSVVERHWNGCAVFLLERRSNHTKRRQLLPASF